MADKKNYSEFIKTLRVIVSGLYSEGEIKQSMSTIGLRTDVSSEAMSLFRKLVKLIMCTGYVSQETQIYVSVPNLTYADIGEMLKKEPSRVKGKVWSDVQKLKDAIGDDTLMRIIYYADEKRLEECDRVLNKEITKYINESLLDNFVIDLKAEIKREEISEEDFNYAMEVLKPYTDGYVSLILRGLGDNLLAYLNYLVYNEGILNDEDTERLKRLKEII